MLNGLKMPNSESLYIGGLYSILGGEYDGTILTPPSVDKKKFTHGQTWYAEWIQMRLDIPNSEYHSLAKSFNPTGFDADAWIREVKNAGGTLFCYYIKTP